MLEVFGDALVVGRQEGEESGRRRHRGQRQRHRGALGRVHQRRRQIIALEAFRAVADAVLNAEIDAQSNEQNRERDREQVERAHHHQPGGGGDGKADEEIDEHREDDLRRMQRHPENHEHDDDGADSVPDGAVLNGGEFLVGDRNRPGQPDPRAVFAREIEVVGRLPDRVGRSLAGLQRVEVQDRLELDEGAPLVADEFAPGEGRRTRLQHILDGLGDQVERPLGAVELDLPALDAGKPGFQRAGQAADRGIAGHDLDQGCCRFELPGQLADLRHRQEQQPVLFKEFSGAELGNRFEVGLVARQFLGQRLGCRAGQFRRRGLDDRENRPVAIEGGAELVIALAPVQIGRNQRVDVGVDGEMPGRIVARRYRENERDQNRERSKPRAGFDNRYDNTGQHIYSL